jgi:DNA (cytosine-5)-methyltransferase 1
MPLFGWRTRYWSFLLKLAKSRPSWTIQAQPGPATGPFHWTSRRLSVQELCRLQTLPDGLRFDCSRNDAQRMLGNAVPSLLAEVMAREIRSQLLGKPTRDWRLKLLPPSRSPTPPAERVSKVPPSYRALAGDHAAHRARGVEAGRVQDWRLEPAHMVRTAVGAVSDASPATSRIHGRSVLTVINPLAHGL